MWNRNLINVLSCFIAGNVRFKRFKKTLQHHVCLSYNNKESLIIRSVVFSWLLWDTSSNRNYCGVIHTSVNELQTASICLETTVSRRLLEIICETSSESTNHQQWKSLELTFMELPRALFFRCHAPEIRIWDISFRFTRTQKLCSSIINKQIHIRFFYLFNLFPFNTRSFWSCEGPMSQSGE